MAAAAIPAVLEAAPAILSGLSVAKGIIGKFAPSAKKVAGMLFKAHSKSPSSLLDKIQGAASTVGNLITSGEALDAAQQLAGGIDTIGNLAGVDTSKYTSKAVDRARQVTNAARPYADLIPQPSEDIGEDEEYIMPTLKRKKTMTSKSSALNNKLLKQEIQRQALALLSKRGSKKIPLGYHNLLEQLK